MKIHELISEGGWANAETQSTQLTPAMVKKVQKFFSVFEKDLNAFLDTQEIPRISFGKLLGSTAHLEHDLVHNKNKEYGDIDVLFVVPDVDDESTSKVKSKYSKFIDEFLKTKKPSYVSIHNFEKSNAIIFKVDGKSVQVDLVFSTQKLKDWTSARSTPEIGIKGAVLGFLYASLAQVLNLSIGTSGVQYKEIGKEIVPFKKLKVDSVKTITTNIQTFGLDILEHLYDKDHSGKPKVHPSLLSKKGITPSNISSKDLVDVIKGLAKSFEINDMYGKGSLKHLSSASDFLNSVVGVYREKIEDAVNATKFDKAQTDAAKKKAEDVKKVLKDQSAKILTYF